MKKWKQLVVFVMILTMVMGMTSFAATGDEGSTEATQATETQPTQPSIVEVAPPEDVTVGDTAVETIDQDTAKAITDGVAQPDTLDDGASVVVGTSWKVEAKEGETEKEAAARVADALAETLQDVTTSKVITLDVDVVNKDGESVAVTGTVVVQFTLATIFGEDFSVDEGYEVAVYHFANDDWTKLNSTLGEDGSLAVTFDNGFSPVTFVVEESKTEEEDPGTTTPEQPGTTQPTQTTPEQPGTTTPEQPGTTTPEQPGTTTPEQPGTTTPEQPGTTTPGDNTNNSSNSNYNNGYAHTQDSFAVYNTPVVSKKFNTIVLNWAATGNSKTRYEVYYAPVSLDDDGNVIAPKDGDWKRATTTKKTTYTFKKAKCGQLYAFFVKEKGTDKASGVWYAKTDLKEVEVRPVLTVKKTTYKNVSLKWTKVTGTRKYEVWRYDVTTGEEVKVAEKSGTSFTDKSVVMNHMYEYWVVPKADQSRGYASVSKTAVPTLKAVVLDKKVKALDGGVQIKWKRVSGATSYQVVRVNNVTGEYKVFDDVRSTTLKDYTREANTTYTYTVTAKRGNALGSCSADSIVR